MLRFHFSLFWEDEALLMMLQGVKEDKYYRLSMLLPNPEWEELKVMLIRESLKCLILEVLKVSLAFGGRQLQRPGGGM